MRQIKFTVFGEPVAKGRPRLGKWGTYTPQKTVNYEQLVKVSYLQTEREKFICGEQLKMEVVAIFAIPKSASKKIREKMILQEMRPIKKPDVDNLFKICADSLNGLAYHDDSQIVSATIDKFYGEEPRVDILITEM